MNALSHVTGMPAVAAATGLVVANAVGLSSRPPLLDCIFQKVKLNVIPFSAHDVYQVCSLAYHNDTLGLSQDPDFMRGLADSFSNTNQTVLTPFQVNLITDTFQKCGIISTPNEVLIPEDEAISPESLLDVLRSMNVVRQRDEQKLEQVLQRLIPLLEEFSPTQLAQAIIELAKLNCPRVEVMNTIAKKLFPVMEDLSALDVSLVGKSLCTTRGVSSMVLRRYFTAVEPHYPHFQPEDYVHLLTGLRALGASYLPVFNKFVVYGLEQVENMDGVTLTHYLTTFVVMGYRERSHIEIYADALVNVATDLAEPELIQALVALDHLQLLNEELFSLMTKCLCRFAHVIPPGRLAAVLDVCSRAPQTNEILMSALMNRMMECVRFFTPHQLAEVTDLISLYPPAKTHPMVPLLGQQGRHRVEIMGSVPLAMITRGLANLGYTDAEFYVLAFETGRRYGFKDWGQLAPIVRGLTISGGAVAGGSSIAVTKMIAAYIAPMTKSMQLQDVLLANKFLCELGCEDDFVFRAMATRVLQFVKEVTPDMPEDLQILLQRGATLVGGGEGRIPSD